MSKKKIAILIVLAVLAVAAAAYYFLGLKSQKDRQLEESRKVEKTNVDFSMAPQKFPANVPIESGARITQNYNSTSADGRFQATRAFETKVTLSENLKIYSEFLKSDGWKVDATTDEANYKMVFGAKGKSTLLISIDENKANSMKTVSITYTE